MTIRKIEIDQLDALAILFDAYRQFYRQSSDVQAARLYLEQRMIQKEAIVFGAFDDDQLIGFTLLYPLFSSVRMKPIYLLNDLFVDPSVRNKSVGKKLLFHAQAFAIETKRAGIVLETEKTNAIGNYLYPSVGFHLEDASNFYFWENK